MRVFTLIVACLPDHIFTRVLAKAEDLLSVSSSSAEAMAGGNKMKKQKVKSQYACVTEYGIELDRILTVVENQEKDLLLKAVMMVMFLLLEFLEELLCWLKMFSPSSVAASWWWV